MDKFKNAEKVGLRDKSTKKLFAVYPNKVEGTDEEVAKVVKDWYYQQSCGSEDRLLTSYVDVLTEKEIKERS
ncbi:MAG: hypothetical protein K0R09_3759 [Clostridiales bacterium]|nr:hypothetical protein [Clostridiales bacterium]